MRQLKISKSITNRNIGALDKYLQDVSRQTLLTVNEEVQLAQRIKAGDQSALDKLVASNLRFVISVAKQYQNQGITLPDLINEGNVGLIKAAKRFDETRGFKFISYAVWWIRQSILQAIAEQSRIVRLPLNQVGAVNRMKKEFGKLEQQLERAPSEEELAVAMDISIEKVQEVIGVSMRSISMDAPLVEDEESNLIDIFISPDSQTADDQLLSESLSMELQRSMATLTEKEREIINLFYGIGQTHDYTIEEIACKFDLTKDRVRQIKEKGIRRLKASSRCQQLKHYLGE